MEEENLPALISLNLNTENEKGASVILNTEQLKQLKSALIGYDNYLKEIK